MKPLSKLMAIGALVAAAVISACGDSGSPSTPPAKEQGTEGAPCFPNGTCMSGLTCLSKTCANAGTGGTGGTTNTGGAANTGGTATCPAGCGAFEECFNGAFCVAKKVPVIGGYSIDATEVTREQYASWLSTNPKPGAGQESFCAWNTDYQPDSTCMGEAKVCQGVGCGNHPQVCVDWCDAYAYCKGVGKRLCGKVGGGANGYAVQATTQSQWYNACSSNGANDYPYGDTYGAQTCNGADNTMGCGSGTCTMLPVGSLPGCQPKQGGYSGVYDLSGNAWEWEDSCEANVGTQDKCHVRGGSFIVGPKYLRCDVDNGGYRDETLAEIGFRCCSI